jgi:hypothetical protein
MHCSKKTGFSEQVKQAIVSCVSFLLPLYIHTLHINAKCTVFITDFPFNYYKVDMESIIAQPVENGEEEKTCMEAVSLVLPKHSTFLENVGLKISSSSKKARVGFSSQVQDLQFELENERIESAQLRQQVEKQSQEMEIQSQEIDSLKKSTAETNALLRQLISFNKGMFKSFTLSVFSFLKIKFCIMCSIHCLNRWAGRKKLKPLSKGQHGWRQQDQIFWDVVYSF